MVLVPVAVTVVAVAVAVAVAVRLMLILLLVAVLELHPKIVKVVPQILPTHLVENVTAFENVVLPIDLILQPPKNRSENHKSPARYSPTGLLSFWPEN